MAFFYLDDSKHQKRGFSLAAFVICETDPTDELLSLVSSNGFNPNAFEFKSSQSMNNNYSLQRLRSELRQFIFRKCRLAVCIVNGENNLGLAALNLLQKALRHESLQSSQHIIYFDEGLFPSKTAARKMAEELEDFKNCSMHFEQDSKEIIGIQVADLAAHTFATMLSETLGFINKMVDIDHSGYIDVNQVELGWELWTEIRYNFLSENKTDDLEGPDFAILNVEPYGLFIHESAGETLRKAAHERFGEMYVGCIH
jgi:hypothetical protein